MTVQTIADFKEKYGTKGFHLLIAEFIARAPEFRGDKELAAAIAQAMGDLEEALKNT